MNQYIKDFLIAAGGGAFSVVVMFTIFKSLFLKVFEKTIDATFEKNIEKYKNTLSRSTVAYEMILKKEMAFYEKMDVQFAILVPLVQDICYYLDSTIEMDFEHRCEKLREKMMQYFKMAPQIKNDVVLFQPYVPQEIFDGVCTLVSLMQNNPSYWHDNVTKVFDNQLDEVDISVAENINHDILMNIAYNETLIKKRLDELSKS